MPIYMPTVHTILQLIFNLENVFLLPTGSFDFIYFLICLKSVGYFEKKQLYKVPFLCSPIKGYDPLCDRKLALSIIL